MATVTSCLRFVVVLLLVTHSAAQSCPSEARADEVCLLSVATHVKRHRDRLKKEAPEMANMEPGDTYGGNHDPSASQCGVIIKAVLSEHGPGSTNPLPADVPARIGAMMGAQFNPVYPEASQFDSECCAKGTEYDKFIASKVQPINTATFLNEVNNNSMLIVVDVQQDFAVGSFGQPCWGGIGTNDRGDAFAGAIAKLAKDMASKGATIVISKDFHPSDHCSFVGTGVCKNTKDATENADERYINIFPSHCTFTIEDGVATPQKGGETPFCQDDAHKALPFCSDKHFVGAALHPTIEKLFWDLQGPGYRSDQVELVFKGINKDYDSFSVIPHTATKGSVQLADAEIMWTGGYAVSGARKTECLATKNLEDPKCYPTAQEIKDPTLKGMRSMTDIMTTGGTEALASVGLVSDFCVKETAIFALEWNKNIKSTAFADLARPSFDGKPGMPWVEAACTGAHEGDYCVNSGGTTETATAVLQDYVSAGVEVKLWR